MQRYEQEIRKTLAANPAIRGLPEFDVKTLTDAFQQGQEAGVKAEEAPTLKQIEAQVLTSRHLRDYALIQREFRPDTAILGKSVGFRKGYIAGLQEFLAEHNVDMGSMLNPNATPEGLSNDDVMIGYLRGIRRQSPNRGRDLFQQSNKLNEFRDYERERWSAGLRLNAAQDQAGYKLGFLVGVARDVNLTLTGLEIPSDNPSYKAFMQGLRGETRAMPIELNPKTDKYRFGLDDGIWVYDALDDSAYKVGQKVWLASEGIDVSYAHFIRHPEALSAFKTALEGQVLPEYAIPSIPNAFMIEIRRGSDYDSMLRKERIYENMPEEKFNKSGRADPSTEARQVGRTGYEMGQLARQSRQRVK